MVINTEKQDKRCLTQKIAVVGMACRFPGAKNYDAFWENAINNIDSTSIISEKRTFINRGSDDGKKSECLEKMRAGLCDDVDGFDAAFFSITPREAKFIDPQQRFCLELAWQCLEDAGYNPRSFSGTKTGVYIGACNFDYKELVTKSTEFIDGHISTGTYATLIPNRISYFLNLKGPSIQVDTACSSSLVALHEACAAINRGECSTALAGGVSILCSPTYFESFFNAGMLSLSGCCKSFDKSANGYIRGEGAGMVLLKRLSNAMVDGDNILGIVNSSAVNHGGKVSTLTSPSAFSQSQVIYECHKKAEVNPAQISYVETHGTGTPKGDPIEISGLARAFRKLAKDAQVKLAPNTCVLGALKTNIGHLEAAAGIAGLIKILLALKHNELPKVLHFEEMNPKIRLEGSPFVIPKKNLVWERAKNAESMPVPRYAGLSSFGFGGVNAHILIEEFCIDGESKDTLDDIGFMQPKKDIEESFLIVLSAKSEGQLQLQVLNLLKHIERNKYSDADLPRIAYTLQAGREAMSFRAAVIVNGLRKLILQLQLYTEDLGNSEWMCDVVKAPLVQGNRVEADDNTENTYLNKNLKLLSQMWLRGDAIDWSELYRDKTTPKKISLPHYPFLKNRYWIDLNVDSKPKNSFASKNSVPIDRKFEHRTDIAVIGMSGQFPQAQNLHQFWTNIKTGRDCISEVPSSRWQVDELYSGRRYKQGNSNSKWMGVLDGAGYFDEAFFNITPLEAEAMDPQQRIVLQSAWECMEDAGLTPDVLARTRTGTYMGASEIRYKNNYLQENLTAHVLSGRSAAMLAARIAYFLNLTGNCVTIDTACSSSLVAIAQACNELVLKNINMAFAGGVYVMTDGSFHGMASQAGMLSPDGRCFSFDSRANGFVPGEGVGVVLLKRLDDALADSDYVYGVIKGWGTNQDGKTNGITAPSVISQVELEQQVYQKFNIDPETITLVEAHGTGTQLGDPIEIEALTVAFQHFTKKTSYCALGTVKSNIGHAISAAGISGFLKALLAIKHRQLPPTINYIETNPHVQIANSPFYVNTKLLPWTSPKDTPRRAAISSFGFSGTNAHIVVEEHLSLNPSALLETTVPNLFVLSAKTEATLSLYAKSFIGFLDNFPQTNLTDVGYTLQVGRLAMRYRLAIIATNLEELNLGLSNFIDNCENDWVIFGDSKETVSKQDNIIRDLSDRKEKWPSSIEWKSVARAWIAGVSISWQQFYLNRSARRLPLLPKYPFERHLYWNPAKIQPTFSSSEVVQASNQERQRPASDAILLSEEFVDFSFENGAADIVDGDQDSEYHIVVIDSEVKKSQAKYLKTLQKRFGKLNVECCRVQDDTPLSFMVIAGDLFNFIKKQMSRKNNNKVKLSVVYRQTNIDFSPGLLAMMRTASLERPRLQTKLITLSADQNFNRIIEELPNDVLFSEAQSEDNIYCHGNMRFSISRLIKSEAISKKEADELWPQGQVYLITGGLGGLGRLCAQWISQRTSGSALVLTGRRAEDDSIRKQLSALDSGDNSILYRQIDLLRQDQLIDDIATLEKDIGKIGVVLHCAGMVRDNFTINKSAEEFKSVLLPKVTGLINLDKATAKSPITFFIHFSSIAGKFGNAGQIDYAAANGFMDGFSSYREKLVCEEQRHGRTLSINWPLWQSDGMRVDEANLHGLKSKGILPLPETIGMQVLECCLLTNKHNITVMYGDEKQILEKVLKGTATFSSDNDVSLPKNKMRLSTEDLQRRVLDKSKELFSRITEIPLENIDSEDSLEYMGIDSIVITLLNQDLEAVFPLLSKTIFFEYDTLAEFSRYLCSEFRDQAQVWVRSKISAGNTGLSLTSEFEVVETVENESEKGRSTSESLPHSSINTAPEIEYPPIAIIGLVGRYPMSENLTEFWDNLVQGRDCVTEIPKERWSLEDFYTSDIEKANQQGKSYSKWGGFINHFAEFDPLFFNISPREARSMDPQERLFIETSWHVIEDAGYSLEKIKRQHKNKVGVFVGVTKTGFNLYGPQLWKQGITEFPHTSFSSFANRVSYLFDFSGPSMPIDTMCSASLTAIHEACDHLHRNNCELAIAGGVNLYLHPSNYVELCRLNMLSNDGQCKSFGASGNGFVPGEGVGACLLKPLYKAVEDNDNIRSVIIGSNINHCGRTKGYTVPNPNAQADLVRGAVKRSGVNVEDISFIEAHGTGTELGDPIEITGLTKAFGNPKKPGQYCAISSAKSNIGHLEAAAGIAGLTKTVLQMQNKQLVPSLHAQELNPNIDFSQTPFRVQRTLENWQPDVDKPHLYAGISAFGAGGANAHVLLQSYEAVNSPLTNDDISDTHLLILSAKEEGRLNEKIDQLVRWLSLQPLSEEDFVRLIYTLQVGREPMQYRAGVMIKNLADLSKCLSLGQLKRNSSKWIKSKVTLSKEAIAKLRQQKGLNGSDDWKCLSASTLLGIWSQGINPHWNCLYTRSHKPLNLPLYPFVGRRFWFDSISVGDTNAKGSIRPRGQIDESVGMARVKQEGIMLSSLQTDLGITQASNQTIQDERKQVHHQDLDKRETKYFLITSLADLLLLSLDEVEEDKSFVELGLDSILGVEWIKKINTRLGANISATRLYEFSNILSLTDYVISETKKSEVFPSDQIQTIENKTDSFRPAIFAIKDQVNVEEVLVRSLTNVLMLQPQEIDFERSFSELGLDSVLGVEWIRAINNELGVNLAATKIYDYPNILCLAKYLADKIDNRRSNKKSDSSENIVDENSNFETGQIQLGENSTELSNVKPKDHSAPIAPNFVRNRPGINLSSLEKHVDFSPEEILDNSLKNELIISNPNLTQSKQSQNGTRTDSIYTKKTIQKSIFDSLTECLMLTSDELDNDAAFSEIGLDSVLGVEWIQKLNRYFGINLPATKLYDYPTVHSLTDFIVSELHEKAATDSVAKDLDYLLKGIYSGDLDLEVARTQINELHSEEVV